MEPFGFFLNVTKQVLILLVIMLTGFVFAKLKLADDKGAKQIANILFYLVTPAVIVQAFASMPYSRENLLYLPMTAGVALFSMFCAAAVATALFRRQPREDKAVLISLTVFANCGFIGLPLAEALYHEIGVFIVSVYIAVFNIVIWTYGLRLYVRDVKLFSLKTLVNPGTVGVALGLPLFLSGTKIPEFAAPVVEGFAAINTPLAMFLVGTYVAGASLKLSKGDGKIVLVLALRHFAIPIITLAAMLLLRLPTTVITASLIPVCAPAGANNVMFAAKFDGNVEPASRTVSLGTLFSVVSMPLMLTLAQLFLR